MSGASYISQSVYAAICPPDFIIQSILISLPVITVSTSSTSHGEGANASSRGNVHLHDAVRGESGRSELRDVPLGSTGLTVEVEGDLSPSKVQAEGSSQLELDGLLGGREAEIVAKGSLDISLGRSREAVDRQSCNVVA